MGGSTCPAWASALRAPAGGKWVMKGFYALKWPLLQESRVALPCTEVSHCISGYAIGLVYYTTCDLANNSCHKHVF